MYSCPLHIWMRPTRSRSNGFVSQSIRQDGIQCAQNDDCPGELLKTQIERPINIYRKRHVEVLSIGMNAVFPPWPIREFRDRSDGIPESGREDSIFRGAGRFFWRTN